MEILKQPEKNYNTQKVAPRQITAGLSKPSAREKGVGVQKVNAIVVLLNITKMPLRELGNWKATGNVRVPFQKLCPKNMLHFFQFDKQEIVSQQKFRGKCQMTVWHVSYCSHF